MIGFTPQIEGMLRVGLESATIDLVEEPNTGIQPMASESDNTKFELQELGATFAAEVSRIDLSASLDDAVFSALKAALFEQHVLVLHGQDWQEGDLVMWGEYGTMHRGAGDYPPEQRRVMLRAPGCDDAVQAVKPAG